MKNKPTFLQHKIADYTRFGQVLLALGTFLFIGLLLPNGEKELPQLLVMMGASVASLAASLFCFYRVKKLRDIEMEEEM
jgi:hypothetical protein